MGVETALTGTRSVHTARTGDVAGTARSGTATRTQRTRRSSVVDQDPEESGSRLELAGSGTMEIRTPAGPSDKTVTQPPPEADMREARDIIAAALSCIKGKAPDAKRALDSMGKMSMITSRDLLDIEELLHRQLKTLQDAKVTVENSTKRLHTQTGEIADQRKKMGSMRGDEKLDTKVAAVQSRLKRKLRRIKTLREILKHRTRDLDGVRNLMLTQRDINQVTRSLQLLLSDALSMLGETRLSGGSAVTGSKKPATMQGTHTYRGTQVASGSARSSQRQTAREGSKRSGSGSRRSGSKRSARQSGSGSQTALENTRDVVATALQTLIENEQQSKTEQPNAQSATSQSRSRASGSKRSKRTGSIISRSSARGSRPSKSQAQPSGVSTARLSHPATSPHPAARASGATGARPSGVGTLPRSSKTGTRPKSSRQSGSKLTGNLQGLDSIALLEEAVAVAEQDNSVLNARVLSAQEDVDGAKEKLEQISNFTAWTEEQVANWMSANGLDDFATQFAEAGVTGARLLELGEEELAGLIPEEEDRVRFAAALETLQSASNGPSILTAGGSRPPMSKQSGVASRKSVTFNGPQASRGSARPSSQRTGTIARPSGQKSSLLGGSAARASGSAHPSRASKGSKWGKLAGAIKGTAAFKAASRASRGTARPSGATGMTGSKLAGSASRGSARPSRQKSTGSASRGTMAKSMGKSSAKGSRMSGTIKASASRQSGTIAKASAAGSKMTAKGSKWSKLSGAIKGMAAFKKASRQSTAIPSRKSASGIGGSQMTGTAAAASNAAGTAKPSSRSKASAMKSGTNVSKAPTGANPSQASAPSKVTGTGSRLTGTTGPSQV